MPASLSAHERELSHFFTRCHTRCLKLLTLFGLGLHIDPSQGGSTWFTDRHQSPTQGPSGCTLRLLYYPSIPENSDYEPDIDIRAGAHSDYGSITLLFQRPGQPGLEILTPGGIWSPVPVFPPGTEKDPSPPILVNIGDLLNYWTNGLFRSTVHRVVFPKEERKGGEDRYSIAFFCHPVNDSALEAVPSEMVGARANGYGQANGEVSDVNKGEGKVITAKEHLLGRLKATYLSLYKDKENGDKETA
jgi:isopenicillin N synthase-like dioxygenase